MAVATNWGLWQFDFWFRNITDNDLNLLIFVVKYDEYGSFGRIIHSENITVPPFEPIPECFTIPPFEPDPWSILPPSWHTETLRTWTAEPFPDDVRLMVWCADAMTPMIHQLDIEPMIISLSIELELDDFDIDILDDNARLQHSGAEYIFGGRTENEEVLGSVYMLNLNDKNAEWVTSIPPMPNPRFGHHIVPMGIWLLMVDGFDGDGNYVSAVTVL